MTLRIVDVSKYQIERSNPLSLAAAQQAGFGAVNIALDRGRAQDVLPGWAPAVASEARARGMDVSTYRWLDNRTPGKTSAQRAYERMVALGGPANMVHSVDVEDNATEETVRDYVAEMTRLLGRPVILYTGDWWWTARGWWMADIAPYLWAAPNAGYLGEYPGDGSPHWTAGYGGWSVLTAMQYAVKPLPGTGDCSLSAVRDMRVWAILNGRGAMRSANMQVLTGQLKQQHPGVVIYGIGDEDHQGSPSGHNEDDTPGSLPEDHDADNKPEHRAIDVMHGPAFSSSDAWNLVTALVTLPVNRARLLYVIYDGWIWRRNGGWKKEIYTGKDKHRTHVHVSGEADDDENTARWVLAIPASPAPQPATPIAQGEEDSMLITFIYATDTKTGQTRWGKGVVSGGEKFWFEADSQDRANAYSVAEGKNATQVSAAAYDAEKALFV